MLPAVTGRETERKIPRRGLATDITSEGGCRLPSSNPDQINEIMQLILFLRPDSVLDVGTGFGKYGFLCREYLEIYYGSEKYNDWQKRIDGIEACAEYITPLQKQIYDNIYIGDANDVLPRLDSAYDLALIINLLEHLSYEAGMKLLDEVRKKAMHIIVSTPKQLKSKRKEKYGNKYEAVRFQWESRHFDHFPQKFIIKNPNKWILYINNSYHLRQQLDSLNLVFEERGPSYYNRAYESDRDTSKYRAIYKRILEWVQEKKAPRVLEVGCGSGDLAIELAENNIPYRGFDFAQKALDLLEQRAPRVRSVCHPGNAYDLENFDGDYNIVVSVEVMEHVDDLRVLRNVPAGKTVILSLPDFMAWSHLRVYGSEQEIRERFEDILDILRIETFKWGCDNKFHSLDESFETPDKNLTIYLIESIRKASCRESFEEEQYPLESEPANQKAE
jgi:2-polyprenyl-3-methyl-5-hydroxy-6-metoxy-1,4-benzoquinol methylase